MIKLRMAALAAAFLCAPSALTAHETSNVHGTAAEAPGQSKGDYHAWLAQNPHEREKVLAFRAFLEAEGVAGVIPTWQLVRTSRTWRQCGATPFEVAPAAQWRNIVRTLSFVKDEVTPAIGPVEALSVYRNERLNSCSRGAKQSAHRMFFAMDMIPAGDFERGEMIRSLCAAHARSGRIYNAGLGFYSRHRFHVDTSGYRKWGVDGRGASSPCNTSRA
jgi:GNAT superfamily N-acetyltransferase